MKYVLNTSNYCDFSVFEKNKLPGRSYFIPYPDRAGADAVSLLKKRYESPKVECLNGDWDFRFYPLPAETPVEFDTDGITFDKLDVPSCWQFRGYAKPFYVNIRYQFPFKPPVIPTTKEVGRAFTWMGCDQKISPRLTKPEGEYNFVGVYRKNFTVEDPEKNLVISFLGVASCLDLYVNGEFVGYSEGSHNTAEFDLTGFVHAGENELVAVVHRWCNGTYLEDQDMFRNNGIFRDVLLRTSEKTDFWDIDAVTQKKEGGYSLTMKASLLSDTEVTFSLEGPGISEKKTVSSKDKKAEVTFEGLSVTEWNAEDPVLYTMYYETATSCVKEKIGFKTVEIQGDVFLLNGRKVKFKGVNHHDSSPVNGYYLSPEEIQRDLEICHDHNMDTVRTSHYPPDPLLLELADEMGMYIVDENDLETHGTWSCQLPPTYNTISHNPKWQAHYVDRITRLYQRDKIHGNTSIIMWSLGNEAGGYANTDAMYDYLKEHSSLPVHYESAIHCKRQAYDVGSEMYPSVAMVHDVGEHKRKQKRLNDRPYFMCEYAHAMGVGPGNIEPYWKEIYSHDNLMGGCVWEMVDHAILHEDGSYTYGGDHGEWEHDSNFCVDGLFYPDRTPSVGAKIMKFIYRPIRVSHLGGQFFEVFNTTSFSAGSRYGLFLRFSDGTMREVPITAGPLTIEQVEVPLTPGEDKLACIALVMDKRTGKEVSEEQVILVNQLSEAKGGSSLPDNFTLVQGRPVITLPSGQVLKGCEPYTVLYRAGTDNDTNAFFARTMDPYLAQTETFVSQREVEGGYEVTFFVANEKASFTVTDTYTGCEGGVLVKSHLHCEKGKGIIPRFGKTFCLDKSFDQVGYYGRKGESYCDMKDQFTVEEVSCKVSDMTEPNIRPQESGNRFDTSWACLSDGKDLVRFEALERPFELGVKPYTDLALSAMRHREDEEATGTYVTIQAFQQGIGTGACGPAIMPEYQFPVKKDYEFQFVIRTGKA